MLKLVLGCFGVPASYECYYGSPSMLIGAFNEIIHLSFPRSFVPRLLDWDVWSKDMLHIYYDSCIVQTENLD